MKNCRDAVALNRRSLRETPLPVVRTTGKYPENDADIPVTGFSSAGNWPTSCRPCCTVALREEYAFACGWGQGFRDRGGSRIGTRGLLMNPTTDNPLPHGIGLTSDFWTDD